MDYEPEDYEPAKCTDCGHDIVPEDDGRKMEAELGISGDQREASSHSGFIHDPYEPGHPSSPYRHPSNFVLYTPHAAIPHDGRSVELDRHMINKAIEATDIEVDFTNLIKGQKEHEQKDIDDKFKDIIKDF